MTTEDFNQLRDVCPLDMERVGVFSPRREWEGRLFRRYTRLPRWRWDLNSWSSRRYDLLVAANVFMYSPDPALWFRNVLASCRYFLLVDLVRRKRSAGSEFGPDGDRMRYSVGNEMPEVDGYYSLENLGERLIAYRTYKGGCSEYDDAPVHVIALFRGDLASPIVRIDDYPTGVRPILEDLAPLHSVIDSFEEREIPYYLGIVPTLLDTRMWSYLRGLKHMIPAVHGYDHAYPRFAPVLIDKGDPFNEKGTVRTFNEFAGLAFPEILERLKTARDILQEGLGQSVTAYIPPCNLADRATGRALEEAGYDRYLSEKKIPGCRLIRIKSDFYGRSDEFRGAARPEVITLHTTWEWDVQRTRGLDSLARMTEYLSERRKVALHLEQSLTERFRDRST